ncbi:MAG: 8-amino-3,8-dideoxy-manno-octulosonate cytidylyltransferase [Syntrophomonadaceae bacterium]|nr:8-amino-3,8-dideoxy-manno-octulosonate cytidylyltransferase [Bacillota bacterium]
MRVAAIIQARMGSTRLPGKVLEQIEGQTMLACVVRRAGRASLVTELVVATTEATADLAIADECRRLGVPFFCGAEHDVLDRYYQAASGRQADVVVRITSDCPFIDPQLIDRVIAEFQRHNGLDYVSNTLPPRTFPRGLDVEVVYFAALERAWLEDDNPAWREHVTPFIYRNPEKFRLYSVTSETDYSDLRLTVDTNEDMALARRVYGYFGHDRFSWREIIKALDRHPQWLEINRHIAQKKDP